MTTQTTRKFKTEREPIMCPDHPGDRLITTTNRTIGEDVVYQRLEQHRCGVLHCGRPLDWAWYRRERDTMVGEGRAPDNIRHVFNLRDYNNVTDVQTCFAFGVPCVAAVVPIVLMISNGWVPWLIAGACSAIALAIALPILNAKRRNPGRPTAPPGYDYWAASQRSVLGHRVEE